MTNNAALSATVKAFRGTRVLVIGDLMLDRFVYGSVERISPEAPVPIFTYGHEVSMLGGAGNVVRNLASLGGSSCFISVIGADATGHALTRLTGEEVGVEPYLITQSARVSTEKTRYIAASQQLLRSDRETIQAVDAATEQRIVQLAEEELPRVQVLVLSDYGKGVITRSLVSRLMVVAARVGVPVLVDPKQRDFGYYAGASVVSPNAKEFLEAAGLDARATEAQITEAAARLCAQHRLGHLLITRGKAGMLLCSASGEVARTSATARDVYDVSGAGDTALAACALALASGASAPEAMVLANHAAGIAVTKLGTAAVFADELSMALSEHAFQHSALRKIMMLSHAREQVAAWRAEGLSVGFTNGCFDIMHAGHATVLADAKSRCDRLVVGVNSDASVRRLKGASRPVNFEQDRAHLLACLQAVDVVVLFDDDTPLTLIDALRPDVLMKGADYTREQVVGFDLVESYGGRVELLPLKAGYSTTGIIEKLATA